MSAMGIVFILPVIYFNDTVIYADGSFYFSVLNAKKLSICLWFLSNKEKEF